MTFVNNVIYAAFQIIGFTLIEVRLLVTFCYEVKLMTHFNSSPIFAIDYG